MVELLTKIKFFALDEKLGSIFGLLLRAEYWCWAGLGQRQWADFLKNLSSMDFFHNFALFVSPAREKIQYS